MPILFQCPHCGAATSVDEEHAGERGPCRNCGETVVIPGTPRTPEKRPLTGLKLFAICVLIAVPLVVVMTALILGVSAFRGLETETESRNNMHKILQAMRDYEEDKGHLPPAFVPDANGKPMHSWRVLLLQYMGAQEQALFKEYKMDEPWNGPNNSLLHAKMPRVYACPATYRDDNRTSYVVIVGKETAFEGANAVKMADIQDGPSVTVLVVDIGASDIPWLEPRDLEYKKIPQFVGEQPLTSHHDGEILVGMVDGTSQKLGDRVEIRPWLTKAAGDKPSR